MKKHLRVAEISLERVVIFAGEAPNRKHAQELVKTSMLGRRDRASLVVQETQVQSLIREDPTWCRGTKPVGHSTEAC